MCRKCVALFTQVIMFSLLLKDIINGLRRHLATGNQSQVMSYAYTVCSQILLEVSSAAAERHQAFCLQQVSLQGRLLFSNCICLLIVTGQILVSSLNLPSCAHRNDIKILSRALIRTLHASRIHCRLFSFLPYCVEIKPSHIQWNITRPLWSRANIDPSPRRHSQQKDNVQLCTMADAL